GQPSLSRRGSLASVGSFVVLGGGGGGGIQLEEVAHGVEHARAAAVAGGLAQPRGGRVQELVEQRAGQRLHRRAVVVRQVAKAAQVALQLVLAHALAVVAERADGG